MRAQVLQNKEKRIKNMYTHKAQLSRFFFGFSSILCVLIYPIQNHGKFGRQCFFFFKKKCWECLLHAFRHGVVWYIIVQYSIVQYSMLQYIMIQHSISQYSLVQSSIVQYVIVQSSLVQSSIVQYVMLQYSIVQYSIV